MEISIAAQSLGLARFAAFGLGLGLLYDLLRPLRYHRDKGFFWDLLFCVLAASGCFMLAMGRGKAGTWELAAAVMFFCLYINYLSPHILPLFLGSFQGLHNCYKFVLQWPKKLQILVKKFFTKRPD